ncbi:lamin tail domain-containing protein [Humibacter ginsenosidimutans]|uniref:lamin tail domain-containing protein n=1 Tax=Humibacter ginsenosidimutans TaxID=2599293 RepID=UPI001FED3FC8|nr:lamin tail domain-containing protein [Humibacter ginsenosidimutans]
MLKKFSGLLALTAGPALVLVGLLAVPSAASAVESTGQIRITEWEYNGSEFAEFTNLDTESIDLAGWSFSDSAAHAGDVDLSSAGIVAPGESFILSEASAADFRSEWGLADTVKVIGGNTQNLGRADAINIYDGTGTLIDSLSYDDQSGNGPRTDKASAWPSSEADLGANKAAEWTLSTVGDAEGSWKSASGYIGSPGVSRFATSSSGGDGGSGGESTAYHSVKINEVTSANDDPYHDAYELVNTSDAAIDVADWKQADSGSTPAALDAPNGTVIPAHGYLVLLSNKGLSSDGDAVKLYLADGTTLVDSVSWGVNDAEPGSWSRCPDASGTWSHTATASWGASNATACAGTIIAPSDPGDGGTQVPCQTEAPSGSGPAIAGGVAWPGSQDWTVADHQCEFVTALSGQDVSGLDIDPATPNVMWAVKNKSHVYRLVKDGDLWVPDTANGWSTGKDIVFPSGSGQPDAEGITVGPDGYLYATTERDNTASKVPLDSVLRYDPNEQGTVLHPTDQWVLTADLADAIDTTGSADSNLGFEGITWVPDSYLTANGFVDQSTHKAYDPADYPGHGTGLYLLALEKNGHLYAYALNGDGSFHRIAAIDTGMPAIAETQWDPDTQRVWAIADNTSAGSTTLMKLDDKGAFVVDVVYNRPTGLPDYNLEGFALAPNSTCVDGVKQVIRSDDGNNDGHSLRAGTIECDLGLGSQGPGTPSTNPTVTATPTTVAAGATITVEAKGLDAGKTLTVVLHSDPVNLGGVTADADGTATLKATIPADTSVGAHTVVVTDASGAAIASTGITVTAAATGSDGGAAAVDPADGALASTGSDTLPWIAVGVPLLLLGTGLMLARRRRAARGDA